MDHNKTPYFTKLVEYNNKNAAHFDVPGHKMGAIKDDFYQYVGPNVLSIDLNAPRGLDNLSNPKGVIKEAQDLMADAFGADGAFLLTQGTSQGIMAMITATVKAKEKILIPRNVHKSIINGLILSGAIPVFIKPQMDINLGIANGVTVADVKACIEEHPDAKAILIINPTYFGVASNIKQIVKLAHQAQMVVLIDEAHGSHFAFHSDLPPSGIQAGADVAACSLHKTVGSLTQSSILLTKGDKVSHGRIRTILNILSSTSPSSLLMASLDCARKNIYFNGPKELERVIKLAQATRERINKIKGVEAILPEYFTKGKEFEYDLTKIIIKVSDLGITGFEAYKEMFDDSKVQLELAETHILLAIFSMGSTQADAEALIKGLEALSNKHQNNQKEIKAIIADTYPESYIRPREAAAHAPVKFVKLADAVDEIAAESIMIYPPGIPIVIPGEILSQDVIEDLYFYADQGSTILSDTDGDLIKVIDKDNWHRWENENEL